MNKIAARQMADAQIVKQANNRLKRKVKELQNLRVSDETLQRQIERVVTRLNDNGELPTELICGQIYDFINFVIKYETKLHFERLCNDALNHVLDCKLTQF